MKIQSSLAVAQQSQVQAPARTIDVWGNRMPMIGGNRLNSDPVVLHGTWASTPVSLKLDGKDYPIVKTDAYRAAVPKFPNRGTYDATVTLANGQRVEVALNVRFAL